MPIFRPGKPWAQLGLSSGATQASGLQYVSWTTGNGDGDFTTTTGTTIVLAMGGLWLIVLNVARDAVASSSEASARIEVNGVDVAGTRSPASTTAVRMSCSYVHWSATPGDEVKAEVLLSNAATVGFDENATNLNLVRIGPVRWT